MDEGSTLGEQISWIFKEQTWPSGCQKAKAPHRIIVEQNYCSSQSHDNASYCIIIDQ